ncbi:BNR-4 repeat-containing protein [Luteolibacter sp. LG18]|uniref:BNR-4 repeat-containing protein n=1 Tax=Luteolibacter sp. LG18 TaxID=2819286 RepID=UPI002B32441A|nr:hypothetical protein llg_26230 [Luteolibacter sp. LG18]
MPFPKSFPTLPLFVAATVALAGIGRAAPYTADANTLLLFHLDESTGSVTPNAGTLGGNAYTVNMTTASNTPPVVTAVLGAAAFSGFTRSAALSSGYLIGWDKNGSGAYQGDGSADGFALTTLNIGNGGQTPFTIEALVCPSVINVNQEILSVDTNVAGTRGFQFRLNTAGQLEFNAIAATSGGQILAAVPANGQHAFAANGWYHAAVTYDGTTLKLYWTSLAALKGTNGRANLLASQAAVIGTAQGAAVGPLAIGNENRGPAGEWFQGKLDEVRISKVARAAGDFHWQFVDTDNDGMDDTLEQLYFGGLSQNANDDFDHDGFFNLDELSAGSDPTVASSTPDGDGDGMPDSWEQAYFGTTTRNGTGDYDRDGLTDKQEYQAGTDPTNPNSVPGDVDGDGLPDTWELANLGGYGYGAYDDPDGDGYTNQAEMVAGTNPLSAASHPAWKSPRVAFLRDTTVTSTACLMPAAPTTLYGRAINGVSFQKQILQTFQGYQYTAWYSMSGTVQNVWLARRSVSATSTGAWETWDTGSEFLNGDEGNWDAHNVIAFGISPVDGSFHFSWDHHTNNLRYRRSIAGLCTTNTAAWGQASSLLAEQQWLTTSATLITGVSYPMFVTAPNGDLYFEYRVGSTSAGDHILHRYQPATSNWTLAWKFSAKEGSYTGVGGGGGVITSTSRNAYENGFDFGPDGTLHHTWTYRETDAANHDIHYAYSTDGGVNWRNNAGAVIANTAAGQSINVNSPGIIMKVLDGRQHLINQQSQSVDADGRLHVLMLHRRAEADAAWASGDAVFTTEETAYYHYFRDPQTGAWSQRRLPYLAWPVNSRPKIGWDTEGNVYAVYTTATTIDVPGYKPGKLVVASASKASGYTDWEVVQVHDTAFNGEPLIDQARLTADHILSVYIQEDSATTTATATPLHVLDFAVGIPAASPVSLAFVGADSVVSVAAAAGTTYQLQTSATLGAGSWQNVGSPVAGKNTVMAFPHVGGAGQAKRFYRFSSTTP